MFKLWKTAKRMYYKSNETTMHQSDQWHTDDVTAAQYELNWTYSLQI